MSRRIAVVAGTFALLLGAAPAAYAGAVPFDASYNLGSQGAETGAEVSHDTGFVGFCGEDTCSGYRLAVATSSVGAGTSQGTVTLRGYLCVLDFSPSCSADPSVAFTGIRITEGVVDVPEAHADVVPVHVTVCRWGGPGPGQCIERLFSDELQLTDTGNVLEIVPSGIGVFS